jgi:anion-transporting  ArsA/GET3 family ATPase
MMGVLDAGVLRYLVRPYFAAGRLTLKIATRTGALALRLADRFLGMSFLQDLSEFLRAFEGMYDGFKERAGRVHALLRDPGSGFVLVASPSPATLDEALYFHRRLLEKQMPFVSFVVNRVHPDPEDLARPRGEAPRRAAGPPAEVDDALAERLIAVYREQQALARLDQRTLGRLEVEVGEPLVTVQELETDVHDLRGLREVARALFGTALDTAPAASAER